MTSTSCKYPSYYEWNALKTAKCFVYYFYKWEFYDHKFQEKIALPPPPPHPHENLRGFYFWSEAKLKYTDLTQQLKFLRNT